MLHNCTDWSTVPPTRKTPLLILSYDDCRLYATVPKSFHDLKRLVWKKFGLEPTEIEFYSSCMNLCDGLLARIDDDIWEHIAPYIGCITVTRKLAPSILAERSESTSSTTVMADGDRSDVPNDFATFQHATDALDGQTRSSQASGDFLQVEPLQPGSPSEGLEVNRQESSVIAGDVIPVRLFSDVTPLQKSPNRWVAPNTNSRNSADRALHTPRRAKCRFTGLLNKLTGKNVGFICDQMMDWITECNRRVQEQVFKMAVELIFERAINEPERMVIYIRLCDTIGCGPQTFQMDVSSPIRRYLLECWQGAFQQGYLSWGVPVRGSLTTHERTIEEHYEAEKAKRRGIGLACLMVELVKPGLITLQTEHAGFMKELGQRLQNNPNEGDIISLCILVRNVNSDNFNWTSKCKAQCSLTARSLADNWRDSEVSGRLRCCLLNLAELCEGRPLSICRCITYNLEQGLSRYSAPNVSRWYATRVTESTTSQTVVDEYFSLVDHDDHWLFVWSLVVMLQSSSMVYKFLASAVQKGLCSLEALQEGFTAAASSLDIMARKDYHAYRSMATILKKVGLDTEERMIQIASHVKNSEELIQLTLW
ncbi:hypothetical protein V8B97DRAFT_224441 [Scleroderma yunnanense]